MRINRLRPKQEKKELPVIIFSDTVVFPYTIVPFFLGDVVTAKAVEYAMKENKDIFLAFQRKQTGRDIHKNNLYETGTVAHILQIIKNPDGKVRILAEARSRGKIKKLFKEQDVLMIRYIPLPNHMEVGRALALGMETLKEAFYAYTRKNRNISPDAKNQIEQAQIPEKIIGFISSRIPFSLEEKILLLEMESPLDRLEKLTELIQLETERYSLKQNISGRVQLKMEKNQKEYFLKEQIREINKELGQNEDDTGAAELESRLNAKTLPREVLERGLKEIKRLKRLQPMSPESGVLRTWLEWLVELPWSESTDDKMNLARAARILDEDHYNLKKAKDRILDHIAVSQIKDNLKGPILCFTGPPGTGKTSLGRSVARTLNRKFVRISLGGVRDEAEIRGHRKTYVGALPGKIIQSMKKAGTANPVILLDEIDKMSNDFRGDPAAALLEVLDPEQNSSFTDHYLELPWDLSRVLFITTANSLHNIPRPLLDRMEVIEIPGYTEMEKLRIARGFIIPKQLKENGVEESRLDITDEALENIIRNYTMESGVRNLERQISRLIRKIAREAIENHQRALEKQEGQPLSEGEERGEKADELPDISSLEVRIQKKEVLRYLETPPFMDEDSDKRTCPGLATGMAWTELGGRILPVEVSLLKGEGKLILTGKLGDVMKESASIALSWIRANAEDFKIDPRFHKKQDIHIHVPEGAIPKDGPSAGITMTAALLSALKGRPLIPGLAMTGEITLTGRLLPIGGVKEKVLAAHRNKYTRILLPEKNRKDQADLPPEIKKDLKFLFSSSVKEALEQILS